MACLRWNMKNGIMKKYQVSRVLGACQEPALKVDTIKPIGIENEEIDDFNLTAISVPLPTKDN